MNPDFSQGERHTCPMATAISSKDLLRIRLATQRISVPAANVVDAVSHLLAIQAQDFAQALWAVALRTRSTTRSGVLAALADGSVVRSLPMRGTLHFLPAEDLHWMLALTSARTLQSTATRFRTLGLDAATFARAENLTVEALAGGRLLARAEYMAMLEAGGVSCEGQRGYHIIFQLSQRGVICWGPPSGTQQALVLVDEWIATAAGPIDEHEALRRFAVRYFSGHGPATERDFAWWTKLKITDARRAIAAAAADLTELAIGDETYWVGSRELDTVPARLGGVYVLPGFDEYLLGYQNRSVILDDEHFDRIVPGSNGIFLPVIVEAGRVEGTWRRVAKSSPPALAPEHFAAATDAQRAAFRRAEARYSAFADR